MAISNENQIGDWIRGKGYLQKCPECKNFFIGRKNRKYCSPVCKIKANNDHASERRKDTSSNIRIIRRNAEILKFYQRKCLNNVPIPIKPLLRAGFDPEGPFKKVKFINKKGEWFEIGNYAYQKRMKGKIYILKLK
jgi:hypothetical protein